jgi:hypothetical protein
MTNAPRPLERVALLIDADNLSADVIEQAIAHLLNQFGAIHFRRAYCSPQKAVDLMDLFRRHSIRPMVNVPTGKNSTDIALAVDAIDLAMSERPGVVVIGSSDSDYAPLAQRLREKGCRVLGIGQAGKTGSESPLAYDDFIDIAHRKVTAPVKASPVPRARAAAPRSRAAVAAPVPVQPPPAPVPALPADVLDVLDAVPTLRGGSAVQLNEVSEALRKHGLLKSKSASPSRYLKRLEAHFELAPADKPRTVRFKGARGG